MIYHYVFPSSYKVFFPQGFYILEVFMKDSRSQTFVVHSWWVQVCLHLSDPKFVIIPRIYGMQTLSYKDILCLVFDL